MAIPQQTAAAVTHRTRCASELIRRTGLAMIAVFSLAAPSLAIPITSGTGVAADNEAQATATPASLFSMAGPPQTLPANSGPELLWLTAGPSGRIERATSSVLRSPPASPPADGDLLTFFIGSEQVTILTVDEAFCAVAGASFAGNFNEARFFVYSEAEPVRASSWSRLFGLRAVGAWVTLGLVALMVFLFVSPYLAKGFRGSA